jgi:hypothetical protein
VVDNWAGSFPGSSRPFLLHLDLNIGMVADHSNSCFHFPHSTALNTFKQQ